MPTKKPTAYSCQIVNASNAYAIGIVSEERRPPEVAEDQDRAPREPVDPDAGGQRDEQEGRELDHVERRDLERADVERDDRDEREGEPGDLRPELADRLRRPELQEVRMPPEPPARPEPHAFFLRFVLRQVAQVRRVDARDEAEDALVLLVEGLEVARELLEPLREAACIAYGHAGMDDDETRRIVVLARVRRDLVRGLPEHQRADRGGVVLFGVVRNDAVETREPAVVLLGEGADLPRADDADQLGVLENLHVVPDRPLRLPERLRELRRRCRALAEEAEDPPPRRVRDRPDLHLGADLEHLLERIVGNGRTFGDRRTLARA